MHDIIIIIIIIIMSMGLVVGPHMMNNGRVGGGYLRKYYTGGCFVRLISMESNPVARYAGEHS